MTTTFINRIGERHGWLVVIGPHERRRRASGRPVIYWFCRCDCGKEKWVSGNNLGEKRRPSKSCGCSWKRRLIRVHGHANRYSRHELYATWVQMRRRCSDPKGHRWKDYGGRGIRVCDEWEKDFVRFIEDVGPRPSRFHSLDRIDVNGNYCPTNCRWATAKEQRLNQRVRAVIRAIPEFDYRAVLSFGA